MADSKIDLHKLASLTNLLLPVALIASIAASIFITPYLYIVVGLLGVALLINIFFRFVQTEHTILRNFGLLGQARYLIESLGPELRQYLFSSDTEERPFNRVERSEVYRKSKGGETAMPFGSQYEFNAEEVKIRHSMYPLEPSDIPPYQCTFGEERGLTNSYTIDKPFLISAMSYGALGKNAVLALSRGARLAGIPMNTGEGGFPKYHLEEKADLIFQLGTAQFGARNEDGSLNLRKITEIAELEHIKMIEIKLSQGAKPGKGGMLPKEKITAEIAELRGVPMGKDVMSPTHHPECTDKVSTVGFIKTIQDACNIPVGIKLCVGSLEQFREFVIEMKEQNIYPDFIAIDGGEGGTGAAPKAFLDNYGMPLLPALQGVNQILIDEGVRDKLKILAAGKLINPGRQMVAMALGADAIYSARGFMLSIGCIQALLCGNNKCPAGITTHDPNLQRGLVVGAKAMRVENYVHGLEHDFYHLLAATGKKHPRELSSDDLYIPQGTALSEQFLHPHQSN